MEQASQGLPGGSDQLEGTSPSFDFSRAELWGGGGNPSSAAGRHPGRGFARRKHAEQRRAPFARFCAEAPALPPRVPADCRRLESHMMSQTMTQAGCLNPTQLRSCTVSHSARCVLGSNTCPNARPSPPASRGKLAGLGWGGGRRASSTGGLASE